MAKAKRPAAQAGPAKSKRTQRVWRVAFYQPLYKAVNANGSAELEEVQYTQRHINPSHKNPAAQLVINRFDGLKQTLPLGEFLAAKYVYEEMLDQSQTRHRGEYKYLRGYWVDERMEPASAARVAAMTGVPPAAVEKAIRQLDRVGLIERLEMPLRPDPEEIPSPPPPATEPDLDGSGGEKPDGKGKKAGKQRTSKSLRSQFEPTSKCLKEVEEESLRPSASAKKGNKNPRPSASAEGEGNQNPAGGPGGPCGNPKPKAEGKAQADQEGNREWTREPKGKAEAALSPTTAPPMLMPILPTEAETRGSQKSKNETLLEGSGIQFADLIYCAIFRDHVVGQVEEARERGEFASMWQRVLLVRPTLESAVLDRLWCGGLEDARRVGMMVGRRKYFREGPGAYWTSIFKKRLAAAVSDNLERTRASPVAVAL